MSNDNSSSGPPFKSSLPPSLLEDLSDKDKFLYQSIDEMKQGQHWLATKFDAHEKILQEVVAQTTRTNGRLLVAEEKIKEAEPAVKAVKSSMRIVKTRWFWVAVAAFLTIGLPWIVNHAPAPEKVIKWAIGMSG